MNSTDPFEAIVNEHYEALYRFALSLTRADAEARDLTQHTFYVWATKGHQLRDLTKVKTWLYTTLHRAFLQGRRRQSRFPQQQLEEVVEQLPVVAPMPADPEDALQLMPALAQLNEKNQAAVALFYLENYAYNEIAVILNVPVGTVKSRIARGIAQLREILLSDDSHASTPLNLDAPSGDRGDKPKIIYVYQRRPDQDKANGRPRAGREVRRARAAQEQSRHDHGP